MMKTKRFSIMLLFANSLLGLLLLLLNIQVAPALAKDNLQITSTQAVVSPTPFESGEDVDLEEEDITLYPAPFALHQNDHFYFTRPIIGEAEAWQATFYRYGVTKDDGLEHAHTGLDIRLPVGTPVYAAGAGTVVWAGYGLYLGGQETIGPYGLAIVIRHDFGYQGKTLYTVYGHLSRIGVRRGQIIDAEQIIALSGNTGISSAPHLHFEVRWGNNDFFSSVNPELWTVPMEGMGLLVGTMTNTYGEKLLGQEIALFNIETEQTIYSQSYSGDEAIGSDPFYNENIVFSDLPPGEYRIFVPYDNYSFYGWMTVQAGKVAHFNFKGYFGITIDPMEIQVPSNLPLPQSNTDN